MLKYPINKINNYCVEKSFKKLQSLCYVIRKIRDESKTHNSRKMPIKSCIIYENDPLIIEELKLLLNLINDEMNCEKYEFENIPKKIYYIKPLFKIIGKKYKNNVSKIAHIMKNIKSECIEEYINNNYKTINTTYENIEYEFVSDEFEICHSNLIEDNNKYYKHDDIIMKVDLSISDEQITKYLGKCFYSIVQSIKKQNKIKSSDNNKIKVSYYTESEEIKKSIQSYQEFIYDCCCKNNNNNYEIDKYKVWIKIDLL